MHAVVVYSLEFRFFIGFLIQFFYYNIKNWVWICWSGQDSNSRRYVLHAVDLISSLENNVFLGWPSTGRTPQCGREREHPFGNPVEVLHTPQPIPQFWPPDSLDYRREPILLIIVLNGLGWIHSRFFLADLLETFFSPSELHMCRYIYVQEGVLGEGVVIFMYFFVCIYFIIQRLRYN